MLNVAFVEKSWKLDALRALGTVVRVIETPDTGPFRGDTTGKHASAGLQIICKSSGRMMLTANLVNAWSGISRIEIGDLVPGREGTIEGTKEATACNKPQRGYPWSWDKRQLGPYTPLTIWAVGRLDAKTTPPWVGALNWNVTDAPGAGKLEVDPKRGREPNEGPVWVDYPMWTYMTIPESGGAGVIASAQPITRHGVPFLVSWDTVKTIVRHGIVYRDTASGKIVQQAVAPIPMGILKAMWESPRTLRLNWSPLPRFNEVGRMPSLLASAAWEAMCMMSGVRLIGPPSTPHHASSWADHWYADQLRALSPGDKHWGAVMGLGKFWLPPVKKDADPFLWGLAQPTGPMTSVPFSGLIFSNASRPPMYNKGMGHPHNSAHVDWSQHLYLMHSTLYDGSFEKPLEMKPVLLGNPKLFTGDIDYGAGMALQTAIEDYVALFQGKTTKGTASVEPLDFLP